MAGLKAFIEGLGVEPRDLAVYRRALTHISCVAEPDESYERLEFLGDSVVGMVVSDFLCRRYPLKEEGELSRIKATVVSRENLGLVADKLDVEKYLRVETARVRSGSKAEFSILGDVFESLVGAIFVDRGYRAARKFILEHLKEACLIAGENEGPVDYKSRLQELWQERYKEPPAYTVVSEKGPDHAKLFTVEVRWKGRLLGRGDGSSKKRAEQEAAKAAMEKEKICKP
jgi:ribonuclease-3